MLPLPRTSSEPSNCRDLLEYERSFCVIALLRKIVMHKRTNCMPNEAASLLSIDQKLDLINMKHTGCPSIHRYFDPPLFSGLRGQITLIRIWGGFGESNGFGRVPAKPPNPFYSAQIVSIFWCHFFWPDGHGLRPTIN